jgi:hypothetical protein
MRPRAFVVMPFGLKEARAATPATDAAPAMPAVHIDFDLVYERLIGPALATAGCAPFRADQEPGAGDIRADMFYELVTADVIVADISVLNANVFYELGVRHGVAPRGVFMVHGGWARRPFDVAPDRTFDYDGRLFLPDATLRADWPSLLEVEAARLGQVLERALDADPHTIGSPVYKELVGLTPADSRDIRTARAKYFGEVFAEWRSRVEVARLSGWPGDILTLAEEAPTRFHHRELLWHAADALCSLNRFEAALPVLRDLLALDPQHRHAQIRMGLVLGRLGLTDRARVHMLQVAERFQHDPEARGILGRTYKDLWQLEWKGLPTLPERQLRAVETSSYIAAAVASYDSAARTRFDYYNGVNVISLLALLEHLGRATGEQPADCKVADTDDLSAVVRFAARSARARAGAGEGQEAVWAAATLGELELVTGDVQKARQQYREAATVPAATYFHVDSMLDQIYLFELLGFRPDAVLAVKGGLEQRKRSLGEKIGALEPRFRRVVLGSGHMIDDPDRNGERFPARKESVVREHLRAQLGEWSVGQGDLAICGGARGADILFAESCADAGAEVWLHIPLPEGEFLERSVRLPGTSWEQRYFALRDRPGVTTSLQPDRLGPPPRGVSVFARNNIWILDTARTEAPQPGRLHALLVWDEEPAADGPGGTRDFAERVARAGGRIATINPKRC